MEYGKRMFRPTQIEVSSVCTIQVQVQYMSDKYSTISSEPGIMSR